MNIGRIFDIAAAIVGVALAGVIVTSPNTSAIITASGSAFSGGLKAALGH